MAHFTNSEISTPLNNSLYTEYKLMFLVFCLDFILYELFEFSVLEMCMGI